MEPFKLPQMSKSEIDYLINSQKISRIAMNGGEYPYLAPFRYVILEKTLYFHFTDYGKKMKLLKNDCKVCVQIEQYEPDLSSYRFVSLCGKLIQVEDPKEYDEIRSMFSETGKKGLSTAFLAAHGLNPEKGWDAFKDEEQLLFMKLVSLTWKIGLKSP